MTVRRGYHEDGNAARERHFAAHPEDRGANIVIFEFYEDEGSGRRGPGLCPAGWAGVRGTLKTASQDVSDAGRVPGATTGSCYPLSIQPIRDFP